MYDAHKCASVSFVTAFDEAIRKRADEEARDMVPAPGEVARTHATVPPPRLVTRDEKVAAALAETLLAQRCR